MYLELLLVAFIFSSAKTEVDAPKGPVIGIDLGTTYSCVGIFKGGRVDIIQNDQGNRITPSYVAFTSEGERLVGDPAKNQLTINPENTIFDAKRLIGREFNDKVVQDDMKNWPFKVINKNGRPYVQVSVGGTPKTFAPEEISAMVLSKMKQQAETYLGTNVTDAVITTPAYFNDAQRQSTKDAGAIAGLNVLRIINEPTAAAIAYGLNKKEGEKNILVYDLGGGTFDVSLLVIDNGVFEVIATNGDTHLGGEDFDVRVIDYLYEAARKAGKPVSQKDLKARQRARRESEKAKRALSKSHETTIEWDIDGGDEFTVTLTRAKFEEMNMDLFRKTLIPLEKVLKDANLNKGDIDEVIMVGGSTRIPIIQKLVKDFFNGKELNRGVNPDEAVAYGAAVQAGVLAGDEGASDLVLLDVNPLSLGIEVVGGVMEMIIKRNSRIPAKSSKVFTTVSDNQEHVRIAVFEGERSMVKDNKLLGQFDLSGIPKGPRGQAQIEVTFQVDPNGIIHVSAVEKGSGKENQITISNEQRQLKQEDIDRMVADAEKYAAEDQKAAERVRAKSEFESRLYSLRNQLKEENGLGTKMSPEEKTTVEKAVDDAVSWVEKNPNASIEEINEQKTGFERVVSPILSKYTSQQQAGGPTTGSEEQPSSEGEAREEL